MGGGTGRFRWPRLGRSGLPGVQGPRLWSARAPIAVAALGLLAAACTGTTPPPSSTTSTPPTTGSPGPPTTSTQPAAPPLVSSDRVFAYLEGLTGIQPFSGWRNSATEGEDEAFAYVEDVLGSFTHLGTAGLELERESFNVFLATELWDTRLFVTAGGQEREVPADAPRGHRHDVTQALRFDSDGVLNDRDRNPVEVAGDVLVVRSVEVARDLEPEAVNGTVAFVDYALLDPATTGSTSGALLIADLIDAGAAGIVLVTSFSDSADGSHGFLAGDGTAVEQLTTERTPPMLYVRLEDFADADIAGWDELESVEGARVIWDTDVFSPGRSGNLVARIPGADPTHAVILGAHIDSPNAPGAIDNGINSAVLLEVAGVLNEEQLQPAVDVYLVWFGSEELWLYGSQFFVNTHQDLLDRTVGAFLMDAIVGAIPRRTLFLDGWSHSRFGDDRLAFPEYVATLAGQNGVTIDEIEDTQSISSDNTVFSGFVPQCGFAFGSELGDFAHTPYGTAASVAALGDTVEQVATVALTVALETGRDLPELRPIPAPDRRAVVVASHTEVAHMTATMLVDFDRALAWEGFDVDAVPYAQPVTANDLAGSELVVVLPVIDYPSPQGGDLSVYDEAWTDDEIESLVTYVENGGLLVVTAGAARVVFGMVFDPNEDWTDMNPLVERFGVEYEMGTFSSSRAQVGAIHPVLDGVSALALTPNNAVAFSIAGGQVLAEAGGTPVAAMVEYGRAGGQVLVLADVTMLGFPRLRAEQPDNFDFLGSLARYAATR